MENNISISYSIMAHPSRSHFVPHLQKVLDAPVSWDRGLGIWDTCKRAWNLHDHNSDYHFVIQDDAILCKNFKNRVSDFVSKFKEEYAYQLYYGVKFRKKEIFQMFNTGLERGYILHDKLMHGISIGMPVRIINDMIDHCNTLEHIPQDDSRIQNFLLSVGIKTIFPIPSLVDHRTCDSLVGGKEGRVAHYFIDNKFDSKILERYSSTSKKIKTKKKGYTRNYRSTLFLRNKFK